MYYRTLSHSHFKVFAAGCLGIYIGSLASQVLYNNRNQQQRTNNNNDNNNDNNNNEQTTT